MASIASGGAAEEKTIFDLLLRSLCEKFAHCEGDGETRCALLQNLATFNRYVSDENVRLNECPDRPNFLEIMYTYRAPFYHRHFDRMFYVELFRTVLMRHKCIKRVRFSPILSRGILDAQMSVRYAMVDVLHGMSWLDDIQFLFSVFDFNVHKSRWTSLKNVLYTLPSGDHPEMNASYVAEAMQVEEFPVQLVSEFISAPEFAPPIPLYNLCVSRCRRIDMSTYDEGNADRLMGNSHLEDLTLSVVEGSEPTLVRTFLQSLPNLKCLYVKVYDGDPTTMTLLIRTAVFKMPSLESATVDYITLHEQSETTECMAMLAKLQQQQTRERKLHLLLVVRGVRVFPLATLSHYSERPLDGVLRSLKISQFKRKVTTISTVCNFRLPGGRGDVTVDVETYSDRSDIYIHDLEVLLTNADLMKGVTDLHLCNYSNGETLVCQIEISEYLREPECNLSHLALSGRCVLSPSEKVANAYPETVVSALKENWSLQTLTIDEVLATVDQAFHLADVLRTIEGSPRLRDVRFVEQLPFMRNELLYISRTFTCIHECTFADYSRYDYYRRQRVVPQHMWYQTTTRLIDEAVNRNVNAHNVAAEAVMKLARANSKENTNDNSTPLLPPVLDIQLIQRVPQELLLKRIAELGGNHFDLQRAIDYISDNFFSLAGITNTTTAGWVFLNSVVHRKLTSYLKLHHVLNLDQQVPLVVDTWMDEEYCTEEGCSVRKKIKRLYGSYSSCSSCSDSGSE